jgi:hypothetical protein
VTTLQHRRNLRRRKPVPGLHWQHILGFMLIVIPVTIWAHYEYKIHACGQLTIVEVCK